MQSGERIVINGREYRLGSVLSTSAGSYGQVWAATDPVGRAVALKFINTEAMSQADPSLHGHWRAHLEREIAFLASLNPARSRHVVTLLDHGQVDGQPVLVMERLQSNLGQWLVRQRRDGAPLPDLPCILDWTDQILDGLDVIHHAGFVYRDLKFSNILVGDRGALLKLADFGSLKREDGDSTRSCIGTPATMAPEQILPVRRGVDGCEYAVDYRADYYALGLLLFTLLTEESTTAAQRRLGQLLAQHGQEGAGQHRDRLGGLTDEERELLRRSIELWTVPVRPDQEQGRAALLTDLLSQLLARDPADRPASSAAIRAVLEAVRTDQPIMPNLSPDGLTLPPDTPPNRHPRRAGSQAGSFRLRRAAGLIGTLGLAGALAWATVLRPPFHPVPPKPLNAVLAPSSTNLPAQPSAAPQSTALVDANPKTANQPPISESPPLPEPPQTADTTVSPPAKATVETDPNSQFTAEPTTHSVTATVAGTMAAPPAEPPAETTADAPAPSTADTTTDAPAPTTADTTTDPPAPTTVDTTTDPPAETAVETEFPAIPTTEPKAEPRTEVVADTPDPAIPVGKIRPAAPTPKSTAPTPKSAAPTAAVTSPKSTVRATVERPTPAIPRKTGSKPVKAASPPDDVVATPPSPSRRLPSAPPLVKPAPKPSTPTAAYRPAPIVKTIPAPTPPAAANRPAPTVKITATQKSSGKVPTPVSQAKSAPKAAPLMTSSKIARSTPAVSTLPPIELVSRTSAATGATSTAQPPIELVSRARIATGTASSKPARTAIATAPRQNPATSSSRPPVRSTVPITNLEKDASRAIEDIRRGAESLGNWAGHTRKEIERSLENANQTVNVWTGNCAKTNGCQPARQVERRDRWSQSNQGVTSRSQPSASHTDEASEQHPRRRPQDYR